MPIGTTQLLLTQSLALLAAAPLALPQLAAASVPPTHCPQYHSFKGDYDPSGPIQTPDGVWHVFPINGGWGHCTSTTLIHWNCSHPKTGMCSPVYQNGPPASTCVPIWNTGAVTVTPSGYCNYPNDIRQLLVMIDPSFSESDYILTHLFLRVIVCDDYSTYRRAPGEQLQHLHGQGQRPRLNELDTARNRR